MRDQLLRFFIEVITSRYLWFTLAMIGFILMLYLWGLFSAIKRTIWDCLTDESGRVTILNVARLLCLVTINFMEVITHLELEVEPHFKIVTLPLSEWEVFLFLSFVAGTQWIFSKFKSTETKPLE